jgi:MFS family permease
LPVVLWFFSLGNTKNIFLIAAIAFVVGIVFDFFYVIWVTTLQQHIPKESLSKVMAYDVLGSLALAPLGIAIAGPLAEEFGSKIVLDWITAFALIALMAPLAFRDVRLTTSKSS